MICSGCSYNLKHTLKMTNTSSFDKDYLTQSGQMVEEGQSRFQSVFRIPKVSGTTGDIQTWDEGVGQDYYKGKA